VNSPKSLPHTRFRRLDRALRTCCALLAFQLWPAPVFAAPVPFQDVDDVRAAAANHLAFRMKEAYPGATPHIEMGQVDPRLRLPACSRLEFSEPAAARPALAGSLGVRCSEPEAWSIFIGFQVRLRGPALLARQPLTARSPIRIEDWDSGEANYGNDPGSYVQTLENLAGSTLSRPVAAGTPLQIQMLWRPRVIRAGQRVSVVIEGPGFQVSQDAIAQNNAYVGEAVKVRLKDRRLLQGRAEADGRVRINP